MAAESWRTDPSVERVLFEEGYRFDFFQAVRLLERLYPDGKPVGQDVDPAREVVRFHAHQSLSFPPSAIYQLLPPEHGTGPAHMTVAFMGLTGPLGALPRHYTELILERLRYHRDRTLRDFLDLFNHRLITLFYRAWEKYRVPIAYERILVRGTGEDRFSQYLFDTIGLGTGGLRGRMAVKDGALLFYAGLLAQRPHSASALCGILQDYFGVPVHIVQFVGAWLPLTHTDRSCLGPEATNNALGSTAVCGDRVWDQQATFQLQVGPLTYAAFCRFLPTGSALQPLLGMTRFYVGDESDFAVQLSLKAAEVPWCRLGATGVQAPRLGWSTWLKTREFCTDATDAVFSSRLTRAAFSASETPPPGRRVAA